MKTKNLIFTAILATSVMVSCKKDEVTPEKADQEIAGEVSGTWTKGTTYKITDDIIINEGQSLTIEAGTIVIFSDTIEKPEVIVKGNLYCLGTAADPIKFTVEDSLKAKKPWGQLWGGIIAGPTSEEIVITHTVLEYGGATTTDASASVKAGLYKATAGENVPVLYYSNVNGKLVFTNNTVHNFAEDGLYIEGGKLIIANNTIYSTGISGGDAINLKSGVLADVAFNLVYSPNTNVLKLSNTGGRTPQAHIIAYNNTLVNAGWRRPTVKGGSIWLEQSVYADLINNLLINNRFGIKRDVKSPEDARSVIANNHYFGNTQTCVNQFQTSTIAGIVGGLNEIKSALVNDNDPKLINYPVSTDINNYVFDASWDFHLTSASPGLNKGKTDFTRHFSEGLIVNGATYISPAPAGYIGAFGTK